mmetsp:Transcript_20500/g.32016  ORF Transcript_20500/g.32016 Transcript_20500/m.32016 type:complete len:222 (-) Transcript_20500:190-855(-)
MTLNTREWKQNLAIYGAVVNYTTFLSCLLISYLFTWRQDVWTECDPVGPPDDIELTNIWPTISSVTGNHYPQIIIFRIGMALTIGPRMLITITNHYPTFKSKPLLFFMMLELFGLLFLSNITIEEQKILHKISTSIFLFAQGIVMLMSIQIRSVWNQRILVNLAVTNALCFPCLLVAYYIHKTSCQPLAYTFFAGAEWVIVITNITFNCLLVAHEEEREKV